MEAGWSDERPNDHDHTALSRDLACPLCEHPAHFYTRCGSLLDTAWIDVLCPCNRVPIPGTA